MTHEQLCGNCAFGQTAYLSNGQEDPHYVICRVKELQNRGRKPDPHETQSAVYRMHRLREACRHWQPEQVYVYTPPLETDWEPLTSRPKPPPMSQSEAPPVSQVDDLKKQLLQKDQYIASLQNENHLLHEQLQQLRHEVQQIKTSQSGIGIETPDINDYFALLGITPQHSMQEIKEAYRQNEILPSRSFLVLSQRLNLAYETLTDEHKRRDYLRQYRKSK